METALDNLTKAFMARRTSPNKGRNTPDHLLAAIAQILDHTPEATLIKQLGVSRAVLDRARALKKTPDKPKRPAPVATALPELDTPEFVPLKVTPDAIGSLGLSQRSVIDEDIPGSSLCMQLPIADQAISINGSAQKIAHVLIQLVRGARI